MADHGDFYIGYQAHAPAGLKLFLRRTVLGLVLLAALVAGERDG